MDKKHFDQLVTGVMEMKRHMSNSAAGKAAGKAVKGARVTEVAGPDVNVRAIREAASISQAQFAKLIGVNLRTLQNWEQHRTRPTGPARVLLKIVSNDPKAAVEAINQ
jgi:putative transcriptional regulator